jgi:hypothetical protein
LIKLLLTQHYASQYRRIRPLCWDLKDTVHSGNIEGLACDGYLLMLNRVSEHVAAEHDDKRLELLRRAFYFKANLPLTDASQGQQRQWRYQDLQHIVEKWHWKHTHISHLDHRDEWQVHDVQAERNALATEFELMPKRLPSLQKKTSQIQLTAILDDQDQVNIYCNGEEFSIWKWGTQLYQKVAQTLLNMRTDQENYPVYLTDLALYGDQSIIQHIIFKQGIEKDLNHALMALSTPR